MEITPKDITTEMYLSIKEFENKGCTINKRQHKLQTVPYKHQLRVSLQKTQTLITDLAVKENSQEAATLHWFPSAANSHAPIQ